MRCCCANCFGDAFLGKQIKNYSNSTGDCSYCNARNVLLIDPIHLRDYFELLLGVYCEDKSGKTLVEWLKSDWSLFGILSNAHCKDLLSEILDDGEIVRKYYCPIVPEDENSLERWQKFRTELKHENRFFPKNIPDLDRLEELLGYLSCDLLAVPSMLFRARIMEGNTPHSPCEMGVPPINKSTHGRANPAGIPYLYLASDIDTAIAEIRPHTGDMVCVAEFELVADFLIADLRNPRKTISPFSLSDEQNIVQLRNDIGFLCQLGEELSKPVLPKTAHLDYLPSQYLCEFIKHRGFGGVMYRSSVGKGTNYAIFDATSTKIGMVKKYRITGVNLDIEDITGAQ